MDIANLVHAVNKQARLMKTLAPWAAPLGAVLVLLMPVVAAHAGEGGTTHVIPGAMATRADNPPTTPGSFIKPMYLHYSGSISATIPTAAGGGLSLAEDGLQVLRR